MTDRVPTGIEGLDELISGGFSTNTVNLITGPAGSAKSLFTMQFLYNGARDYGDVGIYLTLEESRSSILRAMANFGMDLEKLEKEKKLYILDLGQIRKRLHEGDDEKGIVGFEAIQDLLTNLISFTKATRLGVDSLTAIGLYYDEDQGLLRKEMFKFSAFLRQMNVTSVLISESIEGQSLTRYGIEQFIADSFIVQGLEEIKGDLRRTVVIRKMRFTRHDTSKHPFLITPSGISVQSQSKVY